MSPVRAETSAGEYWNFTDVLALAIARTGKARFIRDSARWHQLIADFQQEIGEEAPELLGHVSEQVAHAFSALRMGQVIRQIGYEEYEITDQSRQLTIERETPRLKGFEPVIEKLAAKIEQGLALAA